jgi:hypothetical protein
MARLPNKFDYQLVIHIEDHDGKEYEEFLKRFKRQSFQMEYYHSFEPPSYYRITFGPLAKEGIQNWAARFDQDLYLRTKFKFILEEQRVDIEYLSSNIGSEKSH